MEAVEHTLNGNPDFGRSATVTILRNGDLAGRTCLKVEINAVDLKLAVKSGSCGSETGKVAWVRRLGHAMIKEVEVEIGGSRIDRQYGVWMDVWYELTHTTSKERGYRAMIGDVDALTKLSTINNGSIEELPAYTLYVPLQFWFNRNPGLALPLIALQYHEVRLNFEFEDIQKLVVWSGSEVPDYRQFSMANASILVDYIYLDSEERRRFAQVGHEYLIEQLQFTGVESVTGSNTKLKLGFNHPCKEIIWALRNGNFNGANLKKNGNRFLAYSNDDTNWTNRCCDDNALQAAADNIARGMVYRPGKTLNGISSEAKAIRGPTDGADSFCTSVKFSDGEELKVNVVVNACVSMGVSGASLPSSAVGDWYVLEYPLVNNLSDSKCLVKDLGANKIKEITVSIELNALGEWECYGVRADSFEELTIGDISIPVGCFESDYRATTVNGLNPYDVSVVQLSNYGLKLDGSGNPVAQANIQLNGHDRFDPLDGNYFNYVQPDAHHTRTPADGVNVYSFALHPEQHQPSGTANLSRIDNTQLNITFEDNSRKSSELCINLFSGSLFYVWAVNYNVLRIMSGMGGFFIGDKKNILRILLFCFLYLVPKATRHYEASHNGKIVWTLAKLLKTKLVASKLFIACETPCRSGNPLEPIVLRFGYESSKLAENKNSGIVKINRIGQSACLLPKSYNITHGRASETERVTVDSLINYWLKIQSTPLEKFRGIKEPMPTKQYLCFVNLNNKNILFNKKINLSIYLKYLCILSIICCIILFLLFAEPSDIFS